MKVFQRIFSILLIAGMLLGWTASGSILAQTPNTTKTQSDPAAKLDAQVLQELNEGKADFFVTLTEQADVSKASQLLTKAEKAQYVYETLVATADRTQAGLRAYLDLQGVKYRAYYIINTVLVKAGSLDLAMAIAARDDVAKISANYKYQLEEPIIEAGPRVPSAIEPNISFIKAPEVWALGFTGQGTVVAGNDTGLDATHPTIARHYRGCLNPPTCTEWDHNYNWYDVWDPGNVVPWDDYGHGTHTTGTMVGDDGGINQIGVAPGAQTVHCKNMLGGGGDSEHFILCFEWDLAPWDLNGQKPRPDLAPDSVNNSWGFPGGGDNSMRQAVLNLQASGVVVEVSAGNEGSGCQSLRSPGDYWQVLTTGSVNHVPPYPGTLTGFSSRGPSDLDPTPPNYFPDVMAPGENVRSALPGNQYDYWSGTSMAGPHVTALVGLIWSANPALRGQVDQTIDIIRDTAAPLTGQNGSNCGGDYTTGPNNDWGFGTIDSLAAVQAAIALGGAGKLDGTVTDASTTLPIEGVGIHAAHQEGFAWDDLTDATGYYTMTVAVGTYTVTAETYGYLSAVVTGVLVVTDTVTTQDFALTPAPVYTVSGHVTDSATNAPLPDAKVEFLDAPVAPVYTDPTGFFTTSVAEGTWNMRASADLHQAVEIEVVVESNVTQDFALAPLPCILLVDDDQNAPDVRAAYTDALDNLGYDYNVWDAGSQGDPVIADLAGYMQVVWFTGYPWSGSFTGGNEAAVGAYLDAGGNFFLSSQDYLWEFDLTPFGQNYLHIASFESDVGQMTVTGQNAYAGLGPYTLSYPFTNYSDIVNPDAQAQVAFMGNYGSTAISFAGATFNSVFLGYPFEALPSAGGTAVMQRTVDDFFGGCVPPAALSLNPPTNAQTGDPGADVAFTYTVANVGGLTQDVTLTLASEWPTVVAPDFLAALASGESAVVTVTVSIPTELVSKSDTFTLTATGSEGSVAVALGTTTANVNPAIEVTAPANQSGWPLKVVSYEFTVTNTGDYTDSFALDASGVWTATLPGGTSLGPLAPGASATVVVLVEVPEVAVPGEWDVTTLLVTSVLDPQVSTTGLVTTTATLVRMLPIVSK